MTAAGDGTAESSKQSVWIVRYGLTKFPLVENEGPYDSELDPTEGMEHAKAIAQRIQKEKEPPKLVFCSPFVRTVHTAQLIALDLDASSRVCVEEGLTEWQISSLLVDKRGTKTNPKSTDELASVYGTIDLDYQSLNPVSTTEENFPVATPYYPESEHDLLKRCSTTLERILEFSVGKSFVIVSHAPCDQALAINLERTATASDPSKSKLGPWPLGGITKFSRTIDDDSYGAWNLDFYGDTEHMPGKYKAGLKHWSLPILSGGRKVEKHASFDAI